MYKNGERMLAWIDTISQITKHPNADMLDICQVRGWQVITRKDEFKINEKVIFISIDAFLPIKPEFEFLRASSHKNHPVLGEGFRLKSIRLRSALSQGLILPLSILEQDRITSSTDPIKYGKTFGSSDNVQIVNLEEGSDLTEFLGIQKYEPPQTFGGQINQKGNFPHWIQKSDQERAQNFWNEIKDLTEVEWEISEKIDGCLDAETTIITSKGILPIKEVVNDFKDIQVLSFNIETEELEWDEIVKTKNSINDGKQWYFVELEDGTTMKITGNHYVYLPELRCWRKIENIKEGDEFLLND